MDKRQKNLMEIVEKIGFLSKKKLNEAVEEQNRSGERLASILVKFGHLNKEDMGIALANQFNMEAVKLSQKELPAELLKNFDADLVKTHRFIPIEKVRGGLTIAIDNPLNLFALPYLEALLKCKLKAFLTTSRELNEALEKFFGAGESRITSLYKKLREEDLHITREEEQLEELQPDDAPIIKLVHLLILEAFRSRASDIHLEPLENRFRVRYRIDGVLHDAPGPPKRLEGAVISRVKIMAGMDIAEKRLPQDGRIKVSLSGKDLDLRVSTLPGLYGESVVLRILDRSSLIKDLTELGFSVRDQKKFEELLTITNGIILVTGPTGSGKTTTLYSALTRLNQPDRKIITVENPIEYQISGINQVEVRPFIGLTFAQSLRSILRQAPNIIMIGEIRDLETAEIAIRAALTGHLVLSTLHTNDAPGAITRLIDMGIKPFLAASSLRAVLSQRLVRKICSYCKESYQPALNELREVGLKEGDIPGITFCRGKGCPECNQTGYRDRIGIFELLVLSEELRDLIYHNPSSSQIREIAQKEGMFTLRDDGWAKVFGGITTLTEVLRVTVGDVD